MDLRNALAAYWASCQTNAQLIKQFLAGRKGFDLTYNEPKEFDDMVGVLVDQIDGMEDTWDNIIKIVHQYPIDTHKDSLVMEWSRMVTSTRKIVDRVLEVSDQFHVALPDLGDPDLNKSELYFFAGEHEDIGALDDNLVAENGKSNIYRACQEEGVATDDVTNDEFQVDGNEICQEMR